MLHALFVPTSNKSKKVRAIVACDQVQVIGQGRAQGNFGADRNITYIDFDVGYMVIHL
jgi:hypothetical protein